MDTGMEIEILRLSLSALKILKNERKDRHTNLAYEGDSALSVTDKYFVNFFQLIKITQFYYVN